MRKKPFRGILDNKIKIMKVAFRKVYDFLQRKKNMITSSRHCDIEIGMTRVTANDLCDYVINCRINIIPAFGDFLLNHVNSFVYASDNPGYFQEWSMHSFVSLFHKNLIHGPMSFLSQIVAHVIFEGSFSV